jgi:hypothetical protein
MNCNANKQDLCRLIQNDYKSPLLKFDVDVSTDSFTLNIYGNFSRTLQKSVVGEFADQNTVFFPEFELPKSEYKYEIIITRNQKESLLIFGKYIITDKPNSCGCGGSDVMNFTFDDNDLVLNFTVQETYLGEGGGIGQKGDSAYQVAVKNGFVGTETEWLESLKGADGKDGIDGKDGEKGETGERGLQGIQGERGLQGEVGATGATGAKGDQGIQGIQGLKGDKGDKGDVGITTWAGITDKPATFTPPQATATVLGGIKIWTGTKTAYDAITSKDATVFYFIEKA